jgi:hypothetical protein
MVFIYIQKFFLSNICQLDLYCKASTGFIVAARQLSEPGFI